MSSPTTYSSLATDNWRHRRGREWALSYWNSIARPHRALLLELLQKVEPFESVVELGCGAAACLRLIQARYPGTRCHGIDINVQMLLTAFEEAGVEGWDRYLDLEHDDIVTCQVPPASVVFTSYALAYVHPAELEAVLYKMMVAAARAVILVEPLPPGPRRVVPESQRIEPSGCVPEWAHPYETVIQAQAGWVTEWVPLEPWEGRLTGALLVCRTHMFERSAS